MKKILLLSMLVPAFATIAAADEPSFTVFPATDTPVENIYKVTLTPAGSDLHYYYDSRAEEQAYLSFKAEGSDTEERIALYPGTDQAVIELIPASVVYTAGECELVVPAGTIFGYEISAAGYTEYPVEEPLSYKFNVSGGTANPENLSFSVSPEPGATVKSLEVTFTSTDPTIALTPNMNPLYSNIYYAKDGKMVCLAEAEPSEDGLTMVVTPKKEITELGTYELVISYESLYYYDPSEFFPAAYPNKEPIFYSFNYDDGTSGAALAAAEKENGTVYNLLGVKVADSIEAVGPGIYICGGRKVLK